MDHEELYLGIDIGFDGDVITVPTGDVQVATGRACLEQDLVNELSTPLGDLWYDQTYGFDVYKYLHMESTEINRLDLLQKFAAVIQKNPRIQTASVKAELISWDMKKIKIKASCLPITDGNPINLVAGYGLDGSNVEVV